MSREYLFDCKLFASIRIKAENRKQAEAKIKALLDCAEVNFGADGAGDAVIGEASLDTEDGAELIEVDGEPA